MRRMREFDVVVVGAGPAGIAAAHAAAVTGVGVALVDENISVGGQIWRGERVRPSTRQAARWFYRLEKSRVQVIPATAVAGVARPGVLCCESDGGPVELAWKRLVVATGARELFLPFPGWTLPGVTGAGGLQALVKSGLPVRGARVVVAGSGPLLLAVAAYLREHGADVRRIVEQAPAGRVARFALGLLRHPSKAVQAVRLRARLRGIPWDRGSWPVRAEGDGRLEEVVLTDGRRTRSEPCDYLACGFGLVPNTELAEVLGCGLRDGLVAVDDRQATTTPDVHCAGEPTGIGGVDLALVEGAIAGSSAAGRSDVARKLARRRAAWRSFAKGLERAFRLRDELQTLTADETVVCRCEDVPCGRLRRYRSWRDAKLQTRCGMGPCQGRICGAATRVLFGWGSESVRPPIAPVRVASLIGQSNGDEE